MNNQFNRIDLKSRSQKVQLASLTIKRAFDDSPDLSWLTQDYKECGEEDAAKYREQDRERLERYNNGDWHMIGIRAEAVIAIPVKSYPPSAVMQTISSGGLWGIESDSGEDYLKQVETEELDAVKDLLRKLNVRIPRQFPIGYEDR